MGVPVGQGLGAHTSGTDTSRKPSRGRLPGRSRISSSSPSRVSLAVRVASRRNPRHVALSSHRDFDILGGFAHSHGSRCGPVIPLPTCPCTTMKQLLVSVHDLDRSEDTLCLTSMPRLRQITVGEDPHKGRSLRTLLRRLSPPPSTERGSSNTLRGVRYTGSRDKRRKQKAQRGGSAPTTASVKLATLQLGRSTSTRGPPFSAVRETPAQDIEARRSGCRRRPVTYHASPSRQLLAAA